LETSGRRISALSDVDQAREQVLDLDRDAVAADDHSAVRDRQVVGEDRDLVVLGGVELDDGAAAEPQDLMDRHRRGAENDLDIDCDLVERGHRIPFPVCDVTRSPRYGYGVVNMRTQIPVGLPMAPGQVPVEWQLGAALAPYSEALAVMEERATAIADGRARELVWLIEHPPLYPAGTSARPDELIEARFPVHSAGRGGQFTYHGPGQRVAYLMLDLRQRGQDVRRFVATIEEWIIRTLAAFGIAGERRED